MSELQDILRELKLVSRESCIVDRPATRPSRRPTRRRRAGWVMSLNLTPMIDTVFNLLFFFMVVSRFGAIEGLLPAKLPARAAPTAAATVEVPRTPLRIRLKADAAGRCQASVDRFAEAPLRVGELADLLQRVRAEQAGFDADTPVHLLAPDSVAWDDVVNAYNGAMTAGFEKIFFAGGS